jgi:hypothetical protein
MSWLEGESIQEVNGTANVRVAAVTGAGIVGVQANGVLLNIPADKVGGWRLSEKAPPRAIALGDV